ncbi:hypothetical protein, partial [Aeromonas dhakensis]|uniref:hypothetical protein n=1 Tax=Aeromonas dhakensis TaxID=196024 RepID=UPI001BDE902D
HFSRKPIVPASVNISTQSGSFVNEPLIFHWITLVHTNDRAEFNVSATLFRAKNQGILLKRGLF